MINEIPNTAWWAAYESLAECQKGKDRKYLTSEEATMCLLMTPGMSFHDDTKIVDIIIGLKERGMVDVHEFTNDVIVKNKPSCGRYAHADWMCPVEGCNPGHFDTPIYLDDKEPSKTAYCHRCGARQKLSLDQGGITYHPVQKKYFVYKWVALDIDFPYEEKDVETQPSSSVMAWLSDDQVIQLRERYDVMLTIRDGKDWIFLDKKGKMFKTR